MTSENKLERLNEVILNNEEYFNEVVEKIILHIRAENPTLTHLIVTVKDKERIKQIYSRYKKDDIKGNEEDLFEAVYISLAEAARMIQSIFNYSKNSLKPRE